MIKENHLGTDEKVMLAIVRTAELFKRRSSSIFAIFGLSFSQYNTLRVLEAEESGEQSITEISRRLLISSPNMSGIAKRLEKGGFAVRGRDSADERKTMLRLTPKGRRVLAEIVGRQEENIREFLAGCSAEGRGEFLAVLKGMLKLGG